MSVSARITGVRALNNRLLRLSQPLDDVARRIRIVLHNQHERRVASEKTDPDGTPWAALSPVTLERKTGSMLVESGRLLGSFVSQQTGLIVTEDNQAAPYAKYHQGGTVNMPARPFMGIGRSGEDEIMQACASMIAGRLR